jgi:arsenite oxidase small subunit
MMKLDEKNLVEGAPENQTPNDESRRNFLKISVVLSAILAAGGIAAVTKSVTNRAQTSEGASSTPNTFPKVKIATLSSLAVDQVVSFNYPLDNEPNILIKLGQKASGGVGPDQDIVAFSQLCQHLGCDYAYLAPGTSPKCDSSYKAQGPEGYCCCHGSIYDFTNAGKVLGGPASRPVPQVILEVDAKDDIYAKGMSPPAIFGHSTGSQDVTNDLQGGNVVS